MQASPESDPLVARVATLAIWFGSVDPEPLLGGITNKNFVVRDRGRKYVVRTGGDILVHVFRAEVRDFYNLEKMWSASRPGEQTSH